MQTPIEFAKEFLIQVYTKQDTTAALAFLASDMIWITPEKSSHLKEQKEVFDFLKEEIVAAGEKYYVDVSEMLSDPCTETIRVVTFDVALVPVDPKKTLYMRTSFVIRTENDVMEITFFHMSRKFSLSDPGPFREFVEYLPGPVMIVRGHGSKDLRLSFQNRWFYNHLGYTEKEFDQLSKKDPFFMFLPSDKEQLKKIFSEPMKQALTIRMTAKTKNGGDYRFEVTGKYAFDENEAKVSYLQFHSIDRILATEKQTTDKLKSGHKKELDKLRKELLKKETDSREKIEEIKTSEEAKVIAAKKVTEKILAASKEEQERRIKEATEEKNKEIGELKDRFDRELKETKAKDKEKYDRSREKSEKEIEALKKEIESLTRELRDEEAETKSLKQEIETARGEAKKAEEGRREFLVRVQEQLRKPSEATLGLLDGLIDGGLDDGQTDSVEKIREAGMTMLDMVDSLIGAAKIDNKERQIKEEEFLFPDLCREIRRPFTKRCKEKGIGLKFEVEEGLPEVLIGDKEALKRVLSNVLDNAVKYTGRGGQISFTAGAKQPVDNLYPLVFSVIDTGVGIEDALMPVLFEPFTKGTVEGADLEEYNGFGLGLSTANSLIKMMGGSIGVTSTPGVGSYFTIEVGLRAAIDENGRLKEARDLSKEENKIRDSKEASLPKVEESGRRRVLLAEDDPLSTERIRELLTRKGIALVGAKSGVEALRLFKALPGGSYDAILMDYHMPVMDGLETARRIRQYEKERGDRPVPIIALTQSTFEEDMAGSFGNTIDESLSKPVDAKKLYEVLGRAMANTGEGK